MITQEGLKLILDKFIINNDKQVQLLTLAQKLLELDNRKIEIINPQSNDEDDLMQDFVSIITSFVSRLYGRRRSKRLTEKIIKEVVNE